MQLNEICLIHSHSFISPLSYTERVHLNNFKFVDMIYIWI